MKAVLSCPHPLNAQGPSKPLTRVHEAMAHGWSGRYNVVSPESFPKELVELGRLGEGLGPVFDDLATAHLGAQLHLDELEVFLGGGGASLHQMEAVRKASNAAVGTLWFSSHWKYAQEVLGGEYRKHGITAAPIHPYVAWRAAREQEASDYIIVPSLHCRDTYPSELRSKIRVAEFGVDAVKYHPPASRDWYSGPLKVLFPATNPLRKGLVYVLQAWGQLPSAKFHLTITGAAGLELANKPANIDLRGWVSEEEMMRLMQDHHVLLLPSCEEGQALASLEAAASGMALMLTPNVGLPIEDGVQGFVLKPRNAESISTELVEADDDRQGIAELGANAKAFAEQRPWERFQERVVEILKEESK